MPNRTPSHNIKNKYLNFILKFEYFSLLRKKTTEINKKTVRAYANSAKLPKKLKNCLKIMSAEFLI